MLKILNFSFFSKSASGKIFYLMVLSFYTHELSKNAKKRIVISFLSQTLCETVVRGGGPTRMFPEIKLITEVYEHIEFLIDRLAIDMFIVKCSSSRLGPLDPGLGSVLPRPPIPPSIVSQFKEKVPNSTFTSNPCRIQYCSR